MEKMFANHISDKLIQKICQELIQLDNDKKNKHSDLKMSRSSE